MCPGLPESNAADRNGAASVALSENSQRSRRDLASLGADLADSCFGELGEMLSFSSGSSLVSTFRDHVSGIGCIRSQVQMIDTDASPVITPVHEDLAFWNGSSGEDPSQPMGHPGGVGLSVFVGWIDHPVAMGSNTFRPFPAFRFQDQGSSSGDRSPEICFSRYPNGPECPSFSHREGR